MADVKPELYQLPAPMGSSPQPSAAVSFENNEWLSKQREASERQIAEWKAEQEAETARRAEEERLSSERKAAELRTYNLNQSSHLRHEVLKEPFREYVHHVFNREPGPAENVLKTVGAVAGAAGAHHYVTRPTDSPAWRGAVMLAGGLAGWFLMGEAYKVLKNSALVAIPEALPREVADELWLKFKEVGMKDIPAQIEACRAEWAAMARDENAAQPVNPVLPFAGALAQAMVTKKFTP